MKRYKTLGILLLVLVLICTATFLTSRHEKKQEQIKSTGEPIVTIPEDTPTGKEELHLALTLNREDVQTVDMIFYRQDGTNCLAVVDGKPVSYVSRASVMKLVEAVQAFVL